jgi:tRNA dimethylallyltransferase
VGYRELFDYFEGKNSLEIAIEQIKMNTRRFAKRQMTWFKRTENVNWFDFTTKKTVIIKSLELMIK